VATRSVFFHNGVVQGLEDAVRFYASRDSNPEKWYPRVGASVLKFDDLPESFVENLDTLSPFDKARGAQLRMTDQEVADVVAFLQALNDGYKNPR
jgi:cytochrome c peroxidase